MTDIEVIIELTETVVTIDQTIQSVAIESVGAQGPVGPQGVSGSDGSPGAPGGSRFSFTQASPSSTWVINHNLGYNPHVTVIVNGVGVGADISFNTVNQVSVIFGAPQTGSAELS